MESFSSGFFTSNKCLPSSKQSQSSRFAMVAHLPVQPSLHKASHTKHSNNLPASPTFHVSGAAYLPLEPTHPGARLRFLLEDSLASCLVTCWCARRRNLMPEVPPVNGNDWRWKNQMHRLNEKKLRSSAVIYIYKYLCTLFISCFFHVHLRISPSDC